MICLIAMTVLTLGTLVLAQETDYFVHALGVLAVIWIIVGLLAAHSLGGKVKRPILVETPYPLSREERQKVTTFFLVIGIIAAFLLGYGLCQKQHAAPIQSESIVTKKGGLGASP